MSPDCKRQAAKLVAVPQVPMTWCDVCPAVVATARVGVVVESVTPGVNHDGHVPRMKFVTEPPPLPATVVNGVLTSEILRIAELLVVTIAKGILDVLNPDP
jgi:hypothetical protein